MPGPTPGVWPRGKSGWWYTTIKGTQVKLCQGTKTQALEELRAKLGRPLASARTHRAVGDILDAYLDWMESDEAATKPGRLTTVKFVCKSFYQHAGQFRIKDLSPAHAREWLDLHPTWGSSTRRAYTGVIRACFNWAMQDEVKLVDVQPLGKFKGGAYRRREFLANDAEVDKLLTYPNAAWRDLITALIETGCRPSEVSRVEACDVDLERRCWVMTRHKNHRKKPAPRVVWLTAVMVKLTKRLVKAHSQGPIFRNTYGKAWNAHAVKYAFKQMRKKLNLSAELSSYTLRHWYITRALSRGTDAMTVAAMCGTSIQMLAKHYSHLMQVPEHMLAAVERTGRKRR